MPGGAHLGDDGEDGSVHISVKREGIHRHLGHMWRHSHLSEYCTTPSPRSSAVICIARKNAIDFPTCNRYCEAAQRGTGACGSTCSDICGSGGAYRLASPRSLFSHTCRLHLLPPHQRAATQAPVTNSASCHHGVREEETLHMQYSRVHCRISLGTTNTFTASTLR